LLVEFPSVVDAVRCAVAVQQEKPGRNTTVAADDRIELRIGINLGDVLVEGDDFYGDGVNIAARLEALADAGGVFVSSHVCDWLPFVFDKHCPPSADPPAAPPPKAHRPRSPLLEERAPYLDGIEYTIIKNRATPILGFISGKFDMTFPYQVTIPLPKDVQSQMPQAICDL
jgi:hypothetical protein